MPYKDPEKKKAYYERHKSGYDKKWKEDNRDQWNEYQKSHKIERRRKQVEKIVYAVRDLRIADDETGPGFRAAVVAAMAYSLGVKQALSIAYRTGYDVNEVRGFINNWKKSGEWENGQLYFEYSEGLHFVIELTMKSLVATGEIIAIKT